MQIFPLYLVAVMHVSSLETATGQRINALGYVRLFWEEGSGVEAGYPILSCLESAVFCSERGTALSFPAL